MEQDLIEAKKYLSEQGYGSGTNYTNNLVAVLIANYAQDKVKKLHLHSVSGSVLNINLHEYGYHCGDRCCYNYGTITTVNKTELPCHNKDAGTILRQVLEHLGYCVEITYSDDVS